jgi:hypothetical protein
VGIKNKNKNLNLIYSSIHNSLSPALGFMIITGLISTPAVIFFSGKKYEFALVLQGINWKRPVLLALFYTRGLGKDVLLCLIICFTCDHSSTIQVFPLPF